MFGITDMGTYVIGVVAVILLPGPNSMYCLAVATQYGAARAYRAVAGILLGDSVLMLATALGAASLLRAYPMLFNGLKIAGGLYLAYIGLQLLRGALQKWRQQRSPETVLTIALRPHNPFVRALTLSLSNPKAILFLLSFFVQFVDPNYAYPLLSFLMLALILQVVSLLYLSGLIMAGVRLVHWFRHHHRLAVGAMAAVGLLFIGFALKLWQAGMV